MWKKGNIRERRGLKTNQKIQEKVKKGLRPYYRPGSFEKESKKGENNYKENNWFKNNQSNTQYAAVMFVDATPKWWTWEIFQTNKKKSYNKLKSLNKICFKVRSETVMSWRIKNLFGPNCQDNKTRGLRRWPTRETIELRCNKFNQGSTEIFEFQVSNSELFGRSVPTSQECL